MPPLRVFGRGWHFAGDDLVLPGLVSAFGNVCNLAADVANLATGLPGELAVWFTCAAAISGLSVLLDLCVAYISGRGTMLDPGPRASLPDWLAVRAGVVVAQIVVLLGSTKCVFQQLSEVPAGLASVLIAEWLSLFFFLIVLCTNLSKSVDDGIFLSRARGCIRLLGRCIGASDNDEDLAVVLRELEDFLNGLDVTVSDVAAAKILMGCVQKAVRDGGYMHTLSELGMEGTQWGEEDEQLLKRSCGGAMPRTTPLEDHDVIEELHHFLCFAFAAYGWRMHVLRGQGTISKKPSRRSLSNSITHDMDERAIHATLEEWPGHKRSRLIYLSKTNTKKLPVYAIFADPDRECVVISVRGTLSISDAITDVIALPREICDPAVTGPGPGPHYVHAGMWEAALNIASDVERRQLLEELFGPEAVPDCSGYRLVTVGHSLGAGVAQLLCAHLRKKYPEVRCRCYGPPHICSKSCAEYLGERNISVALGDDIIGRLSIRNAELLRDRMVAIVAHCHLPKWKIIRGGLLEDWLNDGPSENTFSSEPVSERARKGLTKLVGRDVAPRYWHAGRVCYLRVTEQQREPCCKAGKCCVGGARCTETVTDVGWKAEWAVTDDLMEMIVSPNMFAHHFPDGYRKAFEHILEGCPPTRSV